MDSTLVPQAVPDIGGQTFLEVFNTKHEFVDFVAFGIYECTGFFKDFQTYCIHKIKEEDGRRTKSNHRGAA